MTITNRQPRALLVVVGEARTVLPAGAGEAALHLVPPDHLVTDREEGEGVRPHLHCPVQAGGHTGAGARHPQHEQQRTKKHRQEILLTTQFSFGLSPPASHNFHIAQRLNNN